VGVHALVVVRQSTMLTPSARSRCERCAACQGSVPTLYTSKRAQKVAHVILYRAEVGFVAGREGEV
jgi:ferredoxin